MDNQAQPGKIMRGLQTPYIAVLNVFYYLTKWIGGKARNVLVTVCCFGLVIYAALQYSEIFIRDHIHDSNYRMLIICVLVALIALFGMKEKARPVAWSWPPVVFLYLLGISILVARFHHGLATGYVAYALFMIILIPAYGIVWTGRDDYRDLFNRLSFALEVIGILFFIGSIIVWPYAPSLFLEGRYTGLTTNPNILAMLYLCVLIASCYMIYQSRFMPLSIIALGLSVSMLYLSQSRTAFLSAMLAVIAIIICYFRKREPDRIQPKKLILSIILMIIIAAIAVFVAYVPVKYFHYYGIEKIKDEYNSGSKFTLEECEEQGIPVSEVNEIEPQHQVTNVNILDDAILEQYVFDDSYANSPILVEEIAAGGTSNTFTRFSDKIFNVDALSSGRMGAYKWVVQHVTPWGVDRDENPIIVGDLSFTGVHNTVLDFAYQCGWFGGISCLLLKLSAIIFALRFVFGRKKYNRGMLFVILLIAIYTVESSLEIQTLPSSRDITCYYYMVIPFVFAGLKRRKIEQKRESDNV